MRKEHQERVDALFMQELGHTALNFTWNTSGEAEKHIKNIGYLQQELRGLKRVLRSRAGSSTLHLATGGKDSPMRDIDGVIMQLAMTKLQIGKNRYEISG